MTRLAARAAPVLAAVLGGIWIAGGLGVARDVSRAAELGRSGEPAAAAALLRDAAERTSSSAPDLRLAQLERFEGRPARAAALLARIVAREPADADAWAQLALARRAGGDLAGAARARARYAGLSPAVPAP